MAGAQNASRFRPLPIDLPAVVSLYRRIATASARYLACALYGGQTRKAQPLIRCARTRLASRVIVRHAMPEPVLSFRRCRLLRQTANLLTVIQARSPAFTTLSKLFKTGRKRRSKLRATYQLDPGGPATWRGLPTAIPQSHWDLLAPIVRRRDGCTTGACRCRGDRPLGIHCRARIRVLIDMESANANVIAWRMASLKSFFDAVLPQHASWAPGCVDRADV